MFFVFESIPNQHKTQETCDSVVSKNPFTVVYYLCPYRYKTQKMYDKAVDDFLAALKFIPEWYVTSNMIKKLLALYADNTVLYFNEDCGNVIFSCNEMGILSIDLNNINLDDTIIIKMPLKSCHTFGLAYIRIKRYVFGMKTSIS